MEKSMGIHELRRNPQISREAFHELAAKMMGKKSITDSVKRTLRSSGTFFGSQKLSRSGFEKNIRKFAEHLQKQGVETSFSKKVRGSLRSTQGLVAGGAATKFFEQDVKKNMAVQETKSDFSDLDSKTRRTLIQKQMKGELAAEDQKLLSEKGISELQKIANRIKAINLFRRRAENEQPSSDPSKKESSNSRKAIESSLLPLEHGPATGIQKDLRGMKTRENPIIPPQRLSSSESMESRPRLEQKPKGPSENPQTENPQDMMID